MQTEDLIFKAKGGSQKGVNSKSSFGKVVQTINSGLGGDFASIDEKGKLSLNVSREDLKTDEQKGFYDILNTAMTAEKDVNVDVVESDNFVMGGSMQSHKPGGAGIIDIDDIMNFGSGELYGSRTVFGHEIAETTEKQINNNTDYENEEGTGAHQIANKTAANTNGGWVQGVSTTKNKTVKQKSYNIPGAVPSRGAVKSGTVTVPLTRNGQTQYVTYKVVDGNVVKKP